MLTPSHLTKLYLDDRLSIPAIAERVGMARSTVRAALLRAGVSLRTNKEAAASQAARQIKAPDADTLHRQYFIEKQTMRQIAHGAGISASAVHRAMRRYGFETIAERPSPIAAKLEADLLAQLYCVEERSTKEIGAVLGLSSVTVLKYLHEAGIPLRQYTPPVTREMLQLMYVEEESEMANIGAILGIPKHAVFKAIHHYGIPTRTSHPGARKLRDPRYMRLQYSENQKSAETIAKELNVTKGAVLKWLRKHDIEARPSMQDMQCEQLQDGAWLAHQYLVLKKSASTIGREVGAAGRTVTAYLGKHDISRRDASAALRGVPKQITVEGRRKIALAAVRRRGENNPNWKGGATADHRRQRNSKEYVAWARAVKERDNYTCARCGATTGTMDAHHILSFARHEHLRLDVNNGETLCRICHSLHHGRPLGSGDL